jgi:hypothetical protein
MNFCTYSSVLALILAGCLPPPGQRNIPVEYISERVMEVKGWDVGCDNLGKCVAITAVPPRKAKMNGIRGALRVELDHPDGLAAGITIIPLDFEQRLPDVKPSNTEAERILETLRDGDEFLIWVEDGLKDRYYVPGQDFPDVEALHQLWLAKFPVRWAQQEAILPAKGVRLMNFRSPILTDQQLADCKAADKGSIKAAWDIEGQLRLYEYACSDKGSFHPESLWFTNNRQNGKLVPIGISEAVGPQEDGKAAGLYNAYFEESLGLLVTSKLGNPSGDCGLTATYAATPSGLVIAERREARHCIGLFSGDWIRTYRSPAVILPEYW